MSELVFTGDIGFDKYMDHRWEDDNLVSGEVLEFLKSGDHLIINVEGPLSKQEKIIKPNGVAALTHSMDPAVADFFDKIGADVWNINNNHIMDVSERGIRDTLDLAKKHGVKTLGAGMNISEAANPVIFDEAGGIGLIGVGYDRACRKAGEDTPGCLNFSQMDIVKKQIEHVKSKCRWCIIVAHDGEEFTALPSPYTRDRYVNYLEMGADIVVAHHPHVPMNYEIFEGDNVPGHTDSLHKMEIVNETENQIERTDNTTGLHKKAIFYSLGNFIFDTDYQRAQYNTEYGIILKLLFTENEFDFEPFGIKIDRECERIIPCKLPDIFENVPKDEYEKLKPLAAKMFIENTKRQLKYLKPDEFVNATDEEFYVNFYEPLRSGRVPGKLLDFQIVYPLSLEAEKGEWKESTLTRVKEFMLKQI